MICLDANYICPFIVEDDKDKPEQEQTVFYVQFLTVGQRLQLDRERPGMNDIMLKILASNIVGWSNFKDESDNEVPYSVDNLGMIPKKYLEEIYNFIFDNSSIAKDIRNDIKGLVRMHVFMEYNKNNTWNCDDCLKQHLNGRRNCQRFGLDKVEMDEEEKSEISEIKRVEKKKVSKYHLVKKSDSKPDEDNFGSDVLAIGSKKFSTCPLSIVSDDVENAVSLVYWANNSNVLFNSGGILDQTNIAYEIRQTVLSEESATRAELDKQQQNKDDHKNSSKGKFKSSSRSPRR